jgi:hypothetical protein
MYHRGGVIVLCSISKRMCWTHTHTHARTHTHAHTVAVHTAKRHTLTSSSLYNTGRYPLYPRRCLSLACEAQLGLSLESLTPRSCVFRDPIQTHGFFQNSSGGQPHQPPHTRRSSSSTLVIVFAHSCPQRDFVWTVWCSDCETALGIDP